ncbi:hypothetical protein PJV97_09625 [Aliarcobacter butzleri]|uniref:DarT1-associated NADAR antitoxin family protein n=1 Tax=Aliarcobacter butzleri TaxID=28197 RepID=UPI0021B44646|nr:hypothetical protein [Aliarcobacter butzleri]MCT7618375.1 hypothetical protein [Aliarcobacter butzleri]MDN5112603.1 hypothetical protein [Aliarcobacter butzleri]
MAKRPIFIPNINGNQLFMEENIDFNWFSGFAVSQKQKSIESLHKKAYEKGYEKLLEVSSKSSELLGQRLSAFSLEIETKNYGKISVECAFQGSKVFKGNKQYPEIYTKTSIEAKRFHKLNSSGELIGFKFEDEEWELEPKSAFYDWLYIKALYPHKDFLKKLYKYQAFTDIEFNPVKSINCQARTCAIIVSLLKRDLYDEAMSSKKRFIEIIYKRQLKQGELFCL